MLNSYRPTVIRQFDELATSDYISADKLSTWSMAAGIAGLIVAPVIAHIFAIAAGSMALQRANRLDTQQARAIKAKARVGLIFGIFGLVCVTLGTFVVFSLAGASFGLVALLQGAGY